jgi:hypothetical protein
VDERQRWAQAVKRRARWRCEDCGKPVAGHHAHAHHIDGDNQNHQLSNGRLLCAKCHAATHPWTDEQRRIYTAAVSRPKTPEHRRRIGLALLGNRNHAKRNLL